MVVAKDVQSTVDYEAQQFLARGDALRPSIRTSDIRADVNIADHSAALSSAGETKRNDIGWTAMLQILLIHFRDRAATDEGNGDHRVAYALSLQCSQNR